MTLHKIQTPDIVNTPELHQNLLNISKKFYELLLKSKRIIK